MKSDSALSLHLVVRRVEFVAEGSESRRSRRCDPGGKCSRAPHRKFSYESGDNMIQFGRKTEFRRHRPEVSDLDLHTEARRGAAGMVMSHDS